MKKILPLFIVMLLCASLQSVAQMFTSSPSPLQESSENVVITFHADQSGVSGLENLPETTALYAHIGVFTTKSPATWAYVKTEWTENIAANKFTYKSKNTYELTIGDIRSYFGITDATEKVTSICVVARTANGTTQTKDQFIEVVEAGYQMSLTHNATTTILSAATTVTLNVNATEASTLKLSVNGTEVASASATTSLTKEYTFSSRGAYEVVATANNGKETLTQTLNFIYPNDSQAATYPGGVPKMGAVKNADGTVTFCLAAPGKKNVILVPSWDDYKALDKNVMKYHDYNGYRYFWTTVSGLDPDTEYYYYYAVDGTYFVGDPYAKLILDPYSDKWLNQNEVIYPNLPDYPYDKGIDGIVLAVYHENINDYDWKVKEFKGPAKEDLIIYELLFRDFTGDNGKANGNGTIKKALEKIDYLKKLGVNAIELMPIMEFNGNNSWGYNNNFYFAPDKAYGTPDDYKEFIDVCHQNGIAVILDIVFNQSDGLHPWYQMYPVESNPFYNATAPHDYSVLNDWKQDNPLVQQQWKDALQYWLREYKVDGFRFDLVKGLGDNDSYKGGTEAYNQSRVDRMIKLHSYITEVNPNAYHINENLAAAAEENAMAADGQLNWSNINNPSCQFVMGWYEDGNLKGFRASNYGRTAGSTVSYAESHDEQRVGYKMVQWGYEGDTDETYYRDIYGGARRMGSLAAQMILSPGAHMIWQFGEQGNDENTKNDDNGNNTDPKLVNWSSFNSDLDRQGLYQTYCDVINIRKNFTHLFAESAVKTYSTSGFKKGSSTEMLANGGNIFKYVSGEDELYLAVNPGVEEPLTITLPLESTDASKYDIVCATFETTPEFNASAKTITLEAGCFAVIGTSNISGIEDTVADNAKYNVYGEAGRIVIEGEYENAEVYSISGQLQGSLEVPAGLYIVRVDGETTKVIVK